MLPCTAVSSSSGAPTGKQYHDLLMAECIWSTVGCAVPQAMAVVSGARDGIWADLGTGSGALSIAAARCLSNKGRVCAWSLQTPACAVVLTAFCIPSNPRKSCVTFLRRWLATCVQVYAVDASEEAAAWARLNVKRYNLEARLQVSACCMSPTCAFPVASA